VTLPGWLNRSLTALALFAGLLALATFVSRTRSGEAVRPPAVGLPRTPDYHSLLVDDNDGRHLWLGTHVGLYESTDGGRSWRAAGLEGRDVMNLTRGRDGTLWATGHNVAATSRDEGRTWVDLRPRGLPSLDIHGFAVDPGGRLYAAVANEGLFESDDDGATFELVSREVGPTVYGLAVRSGEIFAGDAQKGLVKSNDGGRSWRRTLEAEITAIATSPENRLLATGQATYLSTDGGRRWREVAGVPAEAWPVAWSPRDANVAYVVTLLPDRHLYRSVDAGASWQPVVDGGSR
jgi:photosystem II stability/assembly factor-like uncharacterized protein